ncbi:hypothetical protein RUM43_008829 [Polyplax serrata]|uniref:Uncharacterized protein n=1 Tax=Polyplax serrata TaxID=468196 RepID=A0AAN8NUY5_POLSC
MARKRDERTEEEAAKKRTQKEEESSLGQPDTQEWTWQSRSAKCTVALPKASIFHDSESPMRVEINWRTKYNSSNLSEEKKEPAEIARLKKENMRVTFRGLATLKHQMTPTVQALQVRR